MHAEQLEQVEHVSDSVLHLWMSHLLRYLESILIIIIIIIIIIINNNDFAVDRHGQVVHISMKSSRKSWTMYVHEALNLVDVYVICIAVLVVWS